MENNILKKISKFIVDQRMLVMIVFAAACVYCAMSISKVKVNEDITAFLPANTDTRRGLTIMEEEFTTFASANVMLANTTYDRIKDFMDAPLDRAICARTRPTTGRRLWPMR